MTKQEETKDECRAAFEAWDRQQAANHTKRPITHFNEANTWPVWQAAWNTRTPTIDDAMVGRALFKYQLHAEIEPLAHCLGVTRERVRQIEFKALRKLRMILSKELKITTLNQLFTDEEFIT